MSRKRCVHIIIDIDIDDRSDIRSEVYFSWIYNSTHNMYTGMTASHDHTMSMVPFVSLINGAQQMLDPNINKPIEKKIFQARMCIEVAMIRASDGHFPQFIQILNEVMSMLTSSPIENEYLHVIDLLERASDFAGDNDYMRQIK